MSAAVTTFASPLKPVSSVNITEKGDEEILAIAKPLWRDLIKASNEGKYGEFARNFSSAMALAMNQVVAGHQFRHEQWRLGHNRDTDDHGHRD